MLLINFIVCAVLATLVALFKVVVMICVNIVTLSVYLINIPTICKYTIKGTGPITFNTVWYVPMWERLFGASSEVSDDYGSDTDTEQEDEIYRRCSPCCPYSPEVVTSRELSSRITMVRPIIEQIRALNEKLGKINRKIENVQNDFLEPDHVLKRKLACMRLNLLKVSLDRDSLYLRAKQILHAVDNHKAE